MSTSRAQLRKLGLLPSAAWADSDADDFEVSVWCGALPAHMHARTRVDAASEHGNTLV